MDKIICAYVERSQVLVIYRELSGQLQQRVLPEADTTLAVGMLKEASEAVHGAMLKAVRKALAEKAYGR